MGWDHGGIVVVHQTTNREVLSSIRTGETVSNISVGNHTMKIANAAMSFFLLIKLDNRI